MAADSELGECVVAIATTTVGSIEDARRIAAEVLSKRLVACVQIDGPIESHYVWERRMCVESEWRLVMKTTTLKVDELREAVEAIHPYDLPQWVVVQSNVASGDYARWVAREVQP